MKAHDEYEDNIKLFSTLTPREQEVVFLSSINYTNKDISNKLGIAEATVKMHRNRAFAKLGVANAFECHIKFESMGIDNPYAV